MKRAAHYLWITIQLFRYTWKPWLTSKEFRHIRFYAISAAFICYIAMFMFIFIQHNYILAIFEFLLGCFNWMFNWWIYLITILEIYFEEGVQQDEN